LGPAVSPTQRGLFSLFVAVSAGVLRRPSVCASRHGALLDPDCTLASLEVLKNTSGQTLFYSTVLSPLLPDLWTTFLFCTPCLLGTLHVRTLIN